MNISPKLFYREYFKNFISENSLKELFNDIYPYRLERALGTIRRTFYFATEDGVEYEVVIDKTFLDDLPDELKLVINDAGYVDDENTENYVMAIVFGNLIGPRKIRNYNPNAVRNPSKVLGTVIKIIKDNVKDNEIIYFSSKENNRTKLYSHLVRNLKRPTDVVHQQKLGGGGETEFLLIPRKH